MVYNEYDRIDGIYFVQEGSISLVI